MSDVHRPQLVDEDTCPVVGLIDVRHSVYARCGLPADHEGRIHRTPEGFVEWTLTPEGEQLNRDREAQARALNSPEARLRQEERLARDKVEQERVAAITARKRATRHERGVAAIAEASERLVFVRGLDIFDETSKPIAIQRTHVLVGEKLACRRPQPKDAIAVAGPDEAHPMCLSCVQAFGGVEA